MRILYRTFTKISVIGKSVNILAPWRRKKRADHVQLQRFGLLDNNRPDRLVKNYFPPCQQGHVWITKVKRTSLIYHSAKHNCVSVINKDRQYNSNLNRNKTLSSLSRDWIKTLQAFSLSETRLLLNIMRQVFIYGF